MIADHTSSGWKAFALLLAGMALSTAGIASATITSGDDTATLATEKAQAAAKLDAMVTTGELSAEDYHQEEHGAQGKKKQGEKREATDKNRDIDKLYELVRQARAELQALRVQAGIRGERGEHAEGGREGRGEHAEGGREGRGEHAEGGREGRGEHAEGGREGRDGDEEGGTRIGKHDTWDETRNGVHLILAYNPATQSFKGTVQNTTSKTLSDVRVEVHLSNGVELGPTKRTDLKPGERIAVELSAANQKFTWWTTHPEHGSEEGHGPGDEGERGEHGEGDGNRPKDPNLRPLYNELLLLHHEIKTLGRDLRDRKR